MILFNKSLKVPFCSVVVGVMFCTNPMCWKYTTGKNGSNWVLFGVVYNPARADDVRVLAFHCGPLAFRIGWHR